MLHFLLQLMVVVVVTKMMVMVMMMMACSCAFTCSNVRSHPEEVKYRHIRLSNKSFQSKLWRHELVRTILRQLGWVEEGDAVSMAEYKEGDFDVILASLQEYMK